ncbi:leucine-rich repeat protein [Mediterraneibacter sp. HCN-7094]
MKIKNMILTAVCICFLCLFGSVQVYAAEYYGDFQYEENGESVSIYAYNGSDKEVTIPAYINDKAVTEIKDYAFLLCNSVEKIIVPSTVTTIHTNAFSGAGNLKSVVLASADTKIENSNENTDKKDTDENGNNNSQSNNIGDSTSSKDNKTDTKNTASNSTSTANVAPQYKVTVDSSVDTATEEKKIAEQYSTENKTDDGTAVQNSDTEKQSNGTEIAGIDEGLDADETAINSNADTASEKSQSMPVWGIILLVVVAAIAVAGTVLFIRKKKKQN